MIQQLELNLSGTTCQDGVALSEEKLRKTAGVLQTHLDFAQKRAEIEFNQAQVQVEPL